MRSIARLAVIGIAVLTAACTAPGSALTTPAPSEWASASTAASSAPSGTASPAPRGTVDGSPVPSASPTAQGPWLRAWTTQALPPLNVFAVSDVLDVTTGGVAAFTMAIPYPYPGPAVEQLFGRQLTEAGRVRIIDRARTLGLLDGVTDFGTGSLPGAALEHVALMVDGRAVELTGSSNPPAHSCASPCPPEPGSPEAFAAFWSDLANLDWLGADAAAPLPFQPPVYSVLVGPPPSPDPAMRANVQVWPLETPITAFGAPVANGTRRCGTIRGIEADALRAALAQANALSQWVQSPTTNATFGLTVRPLLDGQDACRDVFGVG